MTAVLLALFVAFVAVAHGGRAKAWVELVLIGCNDDFNSRASNLLELLAHDPDLIFIQEGKAADYRKLLHPTTNAKLLPIHLWGVHQDTSSSARAGSVVIWRHDAFVHTGGGFTFGVKAAGLLTRWIAWVRGTIGGRRAFLFSAHPPPFRARRWWQPYDAALWARCRLALAARRIVLGEMDSNQHGGPPSLPKSLRWVAVGNSIDGFVISRDVVIVEGPTELPKNTSDHHPIKLRVNIPATARRAA